MHGYFLSLKLYQTARIIANPQSYNEHRERVVSEKLEKQAESRIRAKKAQPKVNKALAERVRRIEEREEAKEAKKKHQGGEEEVKEKRNILQDPRFKDLWENPDYEVDEDSREFGLLNPATANNNVSGREHNVNGGGVIESDDIITYPCSSSVRRLRLKRRQRRVIENPQMASVTANQRIGRKMRRVTRMKRVMLRRTVTTKEVSLCFGRQHTTVAHLSPVSSRSPRSVRSEELEDIRETYQGRLPRSCWSPAQRPSPPRRRRRGGKHGWTTTTRQSTYILRSTSSSGCFGYQGQEAWRRRTTHDAPHDRRRHGDVFHSQSFVRSRRRRHAQCRLSTRNGPGSAGAEEGEEGGAIRSQSGEGWIHWASGWRAGNHRGRAERSHWQTASGKECVEECLQRAMRQSCSLTVMSSSWQPALDARLHCTIIFHALHLAFS